MLLKRPFGAIWVFGVFKVLVKNGQFWTFLRIFALWGTQNLTLWGHFWTLLTCFWGLNPDFDLKGRKLGHFGPCFGSWEAVLVVLDPFGSIWQNRGLKSGFLTLLKLILTCQTGFWTGIWLERRVWKLENLKSQTDFENENESTQKGWNMKGKWKFIFKSTER